MIKDTEATINNLTLERTHYFFGELQLKSYGLTPQKGGGVLVEKDILSYNGGAETGQKYNVSFLPKDTMISVNPVL